MRKILFTNVTYFVIILCAISLEFEEVFGQEKTAESRYYDVGLGGSTTPISYDYNIDHNAGLYSSQRYPGTTRYAGYPVATSYSSVYATIPRHRVVNLLQGQLPATPLNIGEEYGDDGTYYDQRSAYQQHLQRSNYIRNLYSPNFGYGNSDPYSHSQGRAQEVLEHNVPIVGRYATVQGLDLSTTPYNIGIQRYADQVGPSTGFATLPINRLINPAGVQQQYNVLAGSPLRGTSLADVGPSYGGGNAYGRIALFQPYK